MKKHNVVRWGSLVVIVGMLCCGCGVQDNLVDRGITAPSEVEMENLKTVDSLEVDTVQLVESAPAEMVDEVIEAEVVVEAAVENDEEVNAIPTDILEAAIRQQKAIELKKLEDAARAQQIAIMTTIVEEVKATMVAQAQAEVYVDAGITNQVLEVLEEGEEIKVVGLTRNGYYLTKADTYILAELFEEKVIPPPTPAPPRTGDANIGNISSWAAIEADVALTGSGTGYHAKLVICTPTSAVSFGIQYDTCARGNYKNRAMCMVENIGSNAKGGQSYFWPGDNEVGLNANAHLMLALNSDGSGSVYLNGTEIGTFYNGNMAYQTVYLRVEGSARKEGDSVNATFSNIRLRNSGYYDAGKNWDSKEFRTNSNIYAWRSGDYVSVSGSVTGIGKADWDSAYNRVSSIIQFIE